MESDEVGGCPTPREQSLDPTVGEQALDEVLAELRVFESPLLFDRQQREPFHQRRGEEAAPIALRASIVEVDRHSFHAAGRRAFLEDVAAKIEVDELRHFSPCEGAHRLRVITPALHTDEPGLVRLAAQLDRLARDPEPELDLGAHRHESNVGRERIGQERVALVAAVMTDTLPEQTGRDADEDLLDGDSA